MDLTRSVIFFLNEGLPAAAIEPVPESNLSTVEERTLEERERWWKLGLKAISDGKLAVLLLSGGQVWWYILNFVFIFFPNLIITFILFLIVVLLYLIMFMLFSCIA